MVSNRINLRVKVSGGDACDSTYNVYKHYVCPIGRLMGLSTATGIYSFIAFITGMNILVRSVLQ